MPKPWSGLPELAIVKVLLNKGDVIGSTQADDILFLVLHGC